MALRHGCSPVNLLHIFRTPFPRNTSEWLFLNITVLLFRFSHLLSRHQRRIKDCCSVQDGAFCDNSWKLLTIITKRSILDVAVVLDPPLDIILFTIFSFRQSRFYRYLISSTISFKGLNSLFL